MEGIVKKTIVGKFRVYTELNAELGYCFYDADEEKENRNYMTHISTPILDDSELERKFIAIIGNADELNKQLEEEIEKLNNQQIS